MSEPPWRALDPGIRKTVKLLWTAGFQPFDSGDGVHKFRTGMACGLLALPEPHVVMSCAPMILISEARRLHELVKLWGDAFMTSANLPIDAQFDPRNNEATITLWGRIR